MAVTLTLTIHTLEVGGRDWAGEALRAKLKAMTEAAGDLGAVSMSLFFLISADWDAKAADPASMLEHGRKGLKLVRQCGYRRMENVAIITTATSLWALGAVTEAEQMFQELLLSDIEAGIVSSYRPFILAWLLADRGDTGEARVMATRLVTSGHARGLPLDEGRGRWVLAEVLRRAGEHEAAEREIEAALPLLGATVALDVPGALATKAALKLAQGRPGEALAAVEEGLSRQAAMKMHDHFFRGSFLRLVHSESLLANGRHVEARAALVNARDRLLAIAAKITEAAYQKSFLENVPENRRTLDLAREWLGEGGEAEPRSQGAPAPASPTAAG
jgi:tetratricopeptide (TPR) repeat protein